MSHINYVFEDATALPDGVPTVLAQVVNDQGKWGRGFVLAVSRRWPEPEAAYHRWFSGPCYDGSSFGHGQTQFIPVGPVHWVANMVAQRGLRSAANPHPLHLMDLYVCLDRVALRCRKLKAGLRLPRIGCGLAGGTWAEVEPILADACKRYGVTATVCDLPG